MTNTIVLKDSSAVDQTFTYVGRGNANAHIYERAGSSLLGRARITLSLSGNTGVNRVKVKLSIPKVANDADLADKATVVWTNVASADFSAVTFSSEESRRNLVSMFAGLMANSGVQNMVTDGIHPAV